jgi:hypothetical protein
MLADPAVVLPNLLVVVYDVDPNTKPEELIASASFDAVADSGLNQWGDRIGSVPSGTGGLWSLEYEDDEFRIRNPNERRPDLLVFVIAPEIAGKPLRDRILFFSPEVRQNAGRHEYYFIEITAQDLKRVGLPIPAVAGVPQVDPGDAQLALLSDRLKLGAQFFDKRGDLLRTQVEDAHTAYAETRTATFSVNVKDELSRVPKDIRDSVRFVREGESVFTKSFDHTRAVIDGAFNLPPPGQPAPTASGFIYLSEAQIAAYAPYIQGDEYVLPPDIIARDILPALFGARDGSRSTRSSTDFLRDDPRVRMCARLVKGDLTCEGHAHDGEGGPVTPPAQPEPPDPDPDPAQPADVFGYVARQMRHMNGPEGTVNFGVDAKPRPTAGEIRDSIAGLFLDNGPADRPAYYDFHTLLIAFDHVWKEAIDTGVLAQSDALYDNAVGVGQKPTNLKGLLANLPSVIRFIKPEPAQAQRVPPPEVIFEFPQAVDLWNSMATNEQIALTRLTWAMLGKYKNDDDGNNNEWKDFLSQASNTVPFIAKDHLIDDGGLDVIAAFRQKGQRILDAVQDRVDRSVEVAADLDRYTAAEALAAELNQKLQERYSFTYFAADGTERSVNFGVLLTYRQEWAPNGYSAGELVRTIPLAPNEVRKYSKKTVVKKTRSQKEIEDNLRITKSDTADTSRAESEIVSKALNKTSFALNTSSTFDIPISDKIKIGNTVTTNLTNDAQRESNETKKDFREAVIKASQEYKSERRVEISTEQTTETETTESGQIENKSMSITVTYLFYELLREFIVNEYLHRMRPVVLVAQELPAPNEIDDAWILRHDWILKRALMDDGYLAAFDAITAVRGEKLMLGELERSVIEQRKIVNDLRQNVRFYTDETGRMSRMMMAAINKEADIVEDKDIWDGIPLIGDRLDAVESAVKGVGSLLGFGHGDDPKEAQRIRREGVKDAYERADRERRELMGRLEHETSVLNGLTREVAEKRKLVNELELQIVRLRSLIKDHILHFMHAIWSHEHPDQRYFRLYNTQVPQLQAPPQNYGLRIKTTPAPNAALDAVANLNLEGAARKTRFPWYCRPQIAVQPKTLAEVADLDNLIGYKGNYMIFPLLQSNVLTDFMMTPYVDSEFGLLDPDAPGNWSLDDFQKLYCCLKEKLGDAFSDVEPELQAFYKELLTDPLRPGELITVPTGSLYIEALPGERPLLDDFMALHRAADVKKVQAEVRKLELENIRYAARILNEERGDPDVDKRVIIEGPGVTVNPDID